MSVNQYQSRQVHVPEVSPARRFDKVLAELLPEFSRSYLQELIKQGLVKMNGANVSPRTPVQGGECIDLEIPLQAPEVVAAEPIALNIIHEDDAVIVINKPPGLVVHPGAGVSAGTLMNALLYHAPDLAPLPRAGIVHRLDKDTSGLMVVAKTESARQLLIDAIQARQVTRRYQTIVQGRVISGGSVDAPIGRHRVNRVKMAITHGGKPAVSHYRVLERLGGFALLEVQLESGRTHQIRVHMAHIGFPVVGDPLYGNRSRIPAGLQAGQRSVLAAFQRQALHAWQLEFEHPDGSGLVAFSADPPADFQALQEFLQALQKQREGAAGA